jgi:hypothetical protein
MQATIDEKRALARLVRLSVEELFVDSCTDKSVKASS